MAKGVSDGASLNRGTGRALRDGILPTHSSEHSDGRAEDKTMLRWVGGAPVVLSGRGSFLRKP